MRVFARSLAIIAVIFVLLGPALEPSSFDSAAELSHLKLSEFQVMTGPTMEPNGAPRGGAQVATAPTMEPSGAAQGELSGVSRFATGPYMEPNGLGDPDYMMQLATGPYMEPSGSNARLA